jgi:hypothetical protein
MKLEVNVPSRLAYVVLILVLFSSGLFAVWAYKSGYTGTESVAEVAKLGHSPNEIEVDLGAGTSPCTGKVTLQYAIANKCLGGGTTTTTTPTSGGGTTSIKVQRFDVTSDNPLDVPASDWDLCVPSQYGMRGGECRSDYFDVWIENNRWKSSFGGGCQGLDAVYCFKVGGTTPGTLSTLGDPKCSVRGGILTGDFAKDTPYTVKFSPAFATNVKPIVQITPDVTDASSSTLPISYIFNVDNTGFTYQSQRFIKNMHFTAFDPACFPAPALANGGVVQGEGTCGVNDCKPGTGGRLMCVNGRWTFQSGIYECP